MQLAKTLILNNAMDNSFKAIVNLKSSGRSEIKFFNKGNLPRSLALGIKQDKKIVKIPLNVDGNSGNFDIKDINLADKILCAVVDVSNPFCPEIILSGSQNSTQANSHIESAFVQSKPKDTAPLYEQPSQDSIEDLIDKNLKEDEESTYFDACAGCKYREAFYSEGGSVCYKKNILEKNMQKDASGQVSTASQDINTCDTSKIDTQPSIIEPLEEKTIEQTKIEPLKEEKNTFYEQVKPQIDALFGKYEPCDDLCQVIPYSKWVKIVYDKEGNFYVLGLIFDEQGNVLYICYGMPAKDPNTPPDELEEYAGFVPKDIMYPDKDGYFVVCQDGVTGRTLKIDLI